MPKIKKLYFILTVFLLVLNSCDTTKDTTGENVPNETNVDPIIIFCPQDSCEKNLIALINYSNSSVHCAFYDLRLEKVIDILASKSHDVDVKIVMETDNYDGQIKGPGIILDDSKPYMHHKFCIIDNSVVWTGSFNPTVRGSFHNNNNVVVFYSKYLAENYESKFNELWNKDFRQKVKHPVIYLNSKKIENYFCPEDCQLEQSSYGEVGGIYKIINLIEKANKSVHVASFSFTHEELADELIRADIRGLKVEVLTEKRQRNTGNSQYERLRDFGVNIRVDNNNYTMHHKFIIIDGKIVATGSPNHTLSGNNRNDENMIIIYDEKIALKYRNEFNRLYDESTVV